MNLSGSVISPLFFLFLRLFLLLSVSRRFQGKLYGVEWSGEERFVIDSVNTLLEIILILVAGLRLQDG